MSRSSPVAERRSVAPPDEAGSGPARKRGRFGIEQRRNLTGWMFLLPAALLALMAGRIHSGLSFSKLWAFYTVLMATLVAVVFLIGWF